MHANNKTLYKNNVMAKLCANYKTLYILFKVENSADVSTIYDMPNSRLQYYNNKKVKVKYI